MVDHFKHTIQSSVVTLDVCVFYSTVLRDQGVSLGAIAAEDGGAIEREIECLGEAEIRVGEEADLMLVSDLLFFYLEMGGVLDSSQ